MSLTGQEKISLSAITKESIATVSGVAVDADLEVALRAKIATWDANRDAVDLILKGGRDGVDLTTQRLLDAITEDVRRWMGFPELKDEHSISLPGTVSVCSSVRWR